jgi:hypothetical protein
VKSIFLPTGEGRAYRMGRISALFKADGDETGKRYSISEWWLEPLSILLGDRWIEAPKASFALTAAGTTHDFENRSSRRAGILNFSIPGGFEHDMPAIAKWYRP